MNFKLLVLFSLFFATVYATSTTAVPEPETSETTEAVAETGTTGEVTGETTAEPVTTGAATTEATTKPTTQSACKDKETDCANKKALCTKTGYVAFMADLCPASCGYCGTGATSAPCVDAREQCAAWNANGYCSNQFYTTESKRASCAKTCNLCQGASTTPCVNADARCASWNKNGYCTNSFYTAADRKKSCAKTCGLC